MGINHDQFEESGIVADIPDNLHLMTGSQEINRFLDNLGIEHNPDSIILEDSFNCVFEGYNDGEYEIWLCHESVPFLNNRAYKVDLNECDQMFLSDLLAK